MVYDFCRIGINNLITTFIPPLSAAWEYWKAIIRPSGCNLQKYDLKGMKNKDDVYAVDILSPNVNIVTFDKHDYVYNNIT